MFKHSTILTCYIKILPLCLSIIKSIRYICNKVDFHFFDPVEIQSTT